MPEATNRVFISIGVAKPRGGLDELPGAIGAAERMAGWAAAQGYETVLIHDREHLEVTVDLLRKEIAAAIKQITDEAELKRLVVFFAGHGAALAVGDQYWILTNWKTRPTEAIKVSSLQRMLEYYGPRQVALIGDACQEFSAKFIDIVGSPVLDMSDEEPRPYELDQFFAVDAGKQAFMIKAAGGQEDFCLFTEVLLDALEGDTPQASFEQIGGDMFVTSQSLALYLDGNVAREAGKYGVRMIPRPKPGFYSDRIYLKIPPPPAATSSLPAGDFSVEQDSFGSDEIAAPPPADSGNAGAGQGAEVTLSFRSVEKVRLTLPNSPPAALAAQTQAILRMRESQRIAFREQVGGATVRDHFETGCGICVSGAEVAMVEASFGNISGVDGEPNWFRIRLEDDDNSLGWSDAVVTLSNGRIYSVCAVQDFVAALHIIDDTSVSLFHRPIGEGNYDGQVAIDLLAKAHAGLLDQDEIINNAAILREGKHRIITLGCIAAQFYDTIRDVNSLRSMASFYAQHKQPVPLDIVLYGGGRISEFEGRLYADIPAVAIREPRTLEERRQRFTFESTPRFEQHPIAGRIPWMRHAWGAILTANCDRNAELWRMQAVAAMEHLAPGAFSSFVSDGRRDIIKLARIEVRQQMTGQSLSM